VIQKPVCTPAVGLAIGIQVLFKLYISSIEMFL